MLLNQKLFHSPPLDARGLRRNIIRVKFVLIFTIGDTTAIIASISRTTYAHIFTNSLQPLVV